MLEEPSACDEAAEVDKLGHAVVPAGATDVEAEVDVDEDRGLVADLYPDLDTTTDAFYDHLPCEPSIGGSLPVETPPPQDELDAEDYVATYENGPGRDLADTLALDRLPAVGQMPAFPVDGCFLGDNPERLVEQPCDSPVFLDAKQPFEGRDIIYVHGLATQHLMDRIANPPDGIDPEHPSISRWPVDVSEFMSATGYFRRYAENYWADHIREHLGQGWQWTPADAAPVYQPKANRYLLVAWSSNQTLEYAQHALLVQIRAAIKNQTNVVTPSTYPANHVRPFCSNGCIVISHSAGSLITSTAMSLAQQGFFGPGGAQVPANIVAHVSFDGAISGSRLASMGMALATAGAPVAGASNVVCAIVDWLFATSNTCNADLAFLRDSILRDLIPAVAQGVWGPVVATSPVPTVTLAGGHPTGDYPLTAAFLPGIDDGVVTMNSACGNPNPVFPGVSPPGGVTVTSLLKAFDFTKDGGRLARATTVFLAQKNAKAATPAKFLAGACTPYLSPTGMVLPVVSAWAGTTLDARRRHPNHYSFVQSIGEHSYDGAGNSANRWPSATGSPASAPRHYRFAGTTNAEESSAVTDASIYTRTLDGNGTRLVKQPVGVREIVRGRKISFKLFKKKYTKWIWKRTYHVLDGWERKQSSHYAYEYIGRR